MRYCSRKSRIPSAAISCRRTIIDWGAIFALVPKAKRLIELHNSQFAMPVFDTTGSNPSTISTSTNMRGLPAKQLASANRRLRTKAKPEIVSQQR